MSYLFNDRESGFLSNYIIKEKEIKYINDREFEIQYFDGEHKNEYLVTEMKNGEYNGDSQLFDRGMIKMRWSWNNGVHEGSLTHYNRGKVAFVETWDSFESNCPKRRIIENSDKGVQMKIIDIETDQVVYEGGYDPTTWNRKGYGYEFDNVNGKLVRCGFYEKDELMQILCEIEGDHMIRYAVEEGVSNIDILNRHVVYDGEFLFDRTNKKIYRHGKGCLIDSNTGMVIWEGQWDHNKQMEGCHLCCGWYEEIENTESFALIPRGGNPIQQDIKVTVHNEHSLSQLRKMTEELIIESYSLLTVQTMNLQPFASLRKLILGDYCFRDLPAFQIVGMPVLEEIKIGDGSLQNTSLLVRACPKLLSLHIGDNSFNKSSFTESPLQIRECDSLKELTVGTESFMSPVLLFEIEGIL